MFPNNLSKQINILFEMQFWFITFINQLLFSLNNRTYNYRPQKKLNSYVIKKFLFKTVLKLMYKTN